MTFSVPKWVLAVLGALVAVGIGVGMTLALTSGDGGSSSSPPAAETSVAPEEEETAAKTAETDDADAATPPDCRQLARQTEEGLCLNKGWETIVVNRDSTLELEELDVRVADIETTTTLTDVGVERANGMFAVVTLEVTNRLEQPVYFSENQEQTLLVTDAGAYTEDFNAENGGDKSSFAWQFEQIQPGTTQVGTVIFDLPPEEASALDRDGELLVLNFSDASGVGFSGRPKLPSGQIRLWADT